MAKIKKNCRQFLPKWRKYSLRAMVNFQKDSAIFEHLFQMVWLPNLVKQNCNYILAITHIEQMRNTKFRKYLFFLVTLNDTSDIIRRKSVILKRINWKGNGKFGNSQTMYWGNFFCLKIRKANGEIVVPISLVHWFLFLSLSLFELFILSKCLWILPILQWSSICASAALLHANSLQSNIYICVCCLFQKKNLVRVSFFSSA